MTILTMLATDILFLKHGSRILRHSWDAFKVSTVFLTGLWALPHSVLKYYSLKMRNKKFLHSSAMSENPTFVL